MNESWIKYEQHEFYAQLSMLAAASGRDLRNIRDLASWYKGKDCYAITVSNAPGVLGDVFARLTRSRLEGKGSGHLVCKDLMRFRLHHRDRCAEPVSFECDGVKIDCLGAGLSVNQAALRDLYDRFRRRLGYALKSLHGERQNAASS